MNIPLIRLLDRYIGAMVIVILKIIKPLVRIDNSSKNILCIQLWGIGETVLTLPAIKSIKKRFPSKRLSVLATFRNSIVYNNQPFVDEVYEIDIRPLSVLSFIFNNFRKYELVFDFEEYLNISSLIAFSVGVRTYGYDHGVRSMIYDNKINYNDKQHVVQTFLDLARIGQKKKDYINYDKLIELKYSWKDNAKTKNLVGKLIGICSGAAESGRSRIWPYYSQLVDKLMEYDPKFKVVFVGTQAEKKSIDTIIKKIKYDKTDRDKRIINLAGKLSLTELFAFIKKCDLFISNDTGPMHIAAAQGVKTIGLFGPNLPQRFGPYGKNRKGKLNIGIYKGSNCSPCINVHLGSIKECDDPICMKKISVEDVMENI
ncbi:glycosyltransferase family 9 protein [Candidatus Woesearchaeota archaeon]|nr:glycosyltransferase family 9 protein [Candidatus Woesearchaeota archaeon]